MNVRRVGWCKRCQRPILSRTENDTHAQACGVTAFIEVRACECMPVEPMATQRYFAMSEIQANRGRSPLYHGIKPGFYVMLGPPSMPTTNENHLYFGSDGPAALAFANHLNDLSSVIEGDLRAWVGKTREPSLDRD